MVRRFFGGLWIGLAALVLVGCSDAEQSKNDRTSMKFSSGRYNQGYKDGMRDAKMSLFDDHAGWTWLWMMEKEYKDGYDRGWSDGRGMVRLEGEKKSTEQRESKQREEQE